VRKRLLSRIGTDVQAETARSRSPRATPRRDRRGRGLRGPLAPPDVPIARTRSERFDDLVLDAVERLDRRWSKQLADLELAVEEVPPATPDSGAHGGAAWAEDPIPLARLFPAAAKLPPRIVLYRRPIEARAPGRHELAALVHDVVVEKVAELLGVEPETVDPGYEGGWA
jgi:predicted Zn-dependent protease with MMP-like domain